MERNERRDLLLGYATFGVLLLAFAGGFKLAVRLARRS